MSDERIGETGNLPGCPKTAAAASYGGTPNAAPRLLHALDSLELGIVAALSKPRTMPIPQSVTQRALFAMAEVHGALGLFCMDSLCRARPRVWLPRLEPIAITEQGVN
jgi:hypothetical protein